MKYREQTSVLHSNGKFWNMETVNVANDRSYRMRMLVWQLAMKKVSMIAGSSDDPLSLTYPAHVAKNSLAFLSSVSFDSIVAHGPGMVS